MKIRKSGEHTASHVLYVARLPLIPNITEDTLIHNDGAYANQNYYTPLPIIRRSQQATASKQARHKGKVFPALAPAPAPARHTGAGLPQWWASHNPCFRLGTAPPSALRPPQLAPDRASGTLGRTRDAS